MSTNNTSESKKQVLLIIEPHVPALPSLTVALDDKKRVTTELVSEALKKQHRALLTQVREIVEKRLVRLEDSRLHFAGPPAEECQKTVDQEMGELASGWKKLQDGVIAEWPSIAAAMERFYIEYAQYVRSRRSTAIQEEAIRERYRVTWRWLRVELDGDLDQAVTTSIAAKVQAYLAEMAGALETMTKRLQKGKPCNRKTIKRLMDAYQGAAGIVPHMEQASRYAEQVEQLAGILESLTASRDACDRNGCRETGLDELAWAVEAAQEQARPLLEAWTGEFGLGDDGDIVAAGAAAGEEGARAANLLKAFGDDVAEVPEMPEPIDEAMSLFASI